MLASLVAAVGLTLAGCASSARLDFLALRGAAPTPTRAAGTTLAEAETSNVGPARPRSAMADAFGGSDFER